MVKLDEKPQNKSGFWATFPLVLISINMQLINFVKKVTHTILFTTKLYFINFCFKL